MHALTSIKVTLLWKNRSNRTKIKNANQNILNIYTMNFVSISSKKCFFDPLTIILMGLFSLFYRWPKSCKFAKITKSLPVWPTPPVIFRISNFWEAYRYQCPKVHQIGAGPRISKRSKRITVTPQCEIFPCQLTVMMKTSLNDLNSQW